MFAKVYGSFVLLAALAALVFAIVPLIDNRALADDGAWKRSTGRLGTLATTGRAGTSIPIEWTDDKGTHDGVTFIGDSNLTIVELYAGKDVGVRVYAPLVGPPKICVEQLFEPCRMAATSWALSIVLGLVALLFSIYGVRVIRS